MGSLETDKTKFPDPKSPFFTIRKEDLTSGIKKAIGSSGEPDYRGPFKPEEIAPGEIVPEQNQEGREAEESSSGAKPMHKKGTAVRKNIRRLTLCVGVSLGTPGHEFKAINEPPNTNLDLLEEKKRGVWTSLRDDFTRTPAPPTKNPFLPALTLLGGRNNKMHLYIPSSDGIKGPGFCPEAVLPYSKTRATRATVTFVDSTGSSLGTEETNFEGVGGLGIRRQDITKAINAFIGGVDATPDLSKPYYRGKLHPEKITLTEQEQKDIGAHKYIDNGDRKIELERVHVRKNSNRFAMYVGLSLGTPGNVFQAMRPPNTNALEVLRLEVWEVLQNNFMKLPVHPPHPLPPASPSNIITTHDSHSPLMITGETRNPAPGLLPTLEPQALPEPIPVPALRGSIPRSPHITYSQSASGTLISS
ncbi:hypothetical protein BDP27DRAFT_1399739 [Rhodocollybia butyracea]|uniref:Uncharacterized protein n=1 Tax=Rhodocollybia butyracea TaxID=206335 RepID=A0A9P5Q4W9_9AGAR|nr:hypothetical protein BDP27DRAFT_1399739 [Rhodocollybia butyracea]